jgi:hypothetical protein
LWQAPSLFFDARPAKHDRFPEKIFHMDLARRRSLWLSVRTRPVLSIGRRSLDRVLALFYTSSKEILVGMGRLEVSSFLLYDPIAVQGTRISPHDEEYQPEWLRIREVFEASTGSRSALTRRSISA